MTPQLTDGSLVLRRLRAGDVSDLHTIFSNTAAMTYWSHGPHQSLEETRAWLDKALTAPSETSDEFAVMLAGRVIGKIGCWAVPEIGFILHPEYWGRGIASSAMRLFLGHLARQERVPGLFADVDPRNTASLRLLMKFGFEQTAFARGTWHTHIGVCDSLYLRLRRDRLDIWRRD